MGQRGPQELGIPEPIAKRALEPPTFPVIRQGSILLSNAATSSTLAMNGTRFS